MKPLSDMPLDAKINGLPNQIDGWYLIHIQGTKDKNYFCVVSTDEGWEHVSVSLKRYDRQKDNLSQMDGCPSWDDMCTVKDIFWNKDETVIQYHPAEKDYVNTHPFVLHLWRPTAQELPTPDPLFVGIPGLRLSAKTVHPR